MSWQSKPTTWNPRVRWANQRRQPRTNLIYPYPRPRRADPRRKPQTNFIYPRLRRADPRRKPRTKPPIFPTSRDWRVTSESQPQTNPLYPHPRDRRPRGRTGHAKRGLRPQGAPAPQRGHSPASVNRYNRSNPNPQSLNPRKRRPVRLLLATPIGLPAPWRIRARYLRGRRSEPALHR